MIATKFRISIEVRDRDIIRAENMKNRLALREQIVGDDAAMATPPNRFRTHISETMPSPEIDEFRQSFAEILTHRVIGIVAKAGVRPEAIGRNEFALIPSPTQRHDVAIRDAIGREGITESLDIELRVGAGARKRSHINEKINPGFLKQGNEIFERSGRMSNRVKWIHNCAIASSYLDLFAQ